MSSADVGVDVGVGAASGSVPSQPSQVVSGPTSTGSTAGPAARTTARAPGASRQGVDGAPAGDARPIQIGVEYLDDVGATASAVYGQALTLGDPEQVARAMVRWVNKHGGLAGRKIKPIFHGTKYEDALRDPVGAAEAACARFTQDAKVAAATILTTHENLISCLAKNDVVSIASGYPLDETYFAQYAAHYFAPGTMHLTRANAVLVQQLGAAGWLRDARIGVAYRDSMPYRRAADALVAQLEAQGAEVVATFGVNESDLSQRPPQNANAVLQFRSKGATHVMFVDRGGSVSYYFMTAAENQGYRPLYGLSTNNNLATLQQLAPKAQLAGATGVSFGPYDVLRPQDPGPNGARRRCLKIMRAEGMDLSDRNAEGAAMLYCDYFLFLKAAVDAAGRADAASIRRAVDAFAGSYESALVFQTRFGADKHDGAAAIRMVGRGRDCDCWVYRSGVRPVR